MMQDNDRGEVEDVNGCVEGQHHVFDPHVSFCRCGTLERSFPSISHIVWAVAVWPAKPTTVYAVQFSNYDPAEINSLWLDKEKAEARVEELSTGQGEGGWGWDVVEWKLAG